MTDTTPDAELRAAAAKLRDLATAATPGPWRQHDTHLGQYGYTATVLSGEGNETDLRAWLPSMSQEPWDETRNVWPDAAFIAAMHPGVGAALADWLDSWTGIEVREDGPMDDDLRHALAVARALNGGQPFTPPVHYERSDGALCCVHAIPVGPDSCADCRDLADEEPTP